MEPQIGSGACRCASFLDGSHFKVDHRDDLVFFSFLDFSCACREDLKMSNILTTLRDALKGFHTSVIEPGISPLITIKGTYPFY